MKGLPLQQQTQMKNTVLKEETKNKKYVYKWSQRDHKRLGRLNLGQKPRIGAT